MVSTMTTNILVVEDENIVAKDIKDRLESLGYTVPGIASSGNKALEIINSVRIDLVLMDIMIKGDIDGIQTADRIRATHSIPIVYLTAYADQSTLERAKITEPYGYILKPFEERELHTSIEMALYKHKIENRLRESEQWFSTTLTCIGDAVIATNAYGTIRFINPVAKQLTGWPDNEAVGCTLNNVLKLENDVPDNFSSDVLNIVLEKKRVYSPQENLLLVSKSGERIPVEAKAAPLRDAHNNINGVVVTFGDISERRRAEDEINHINEKLLKANNELKTLDKLKNNLLSNVSHELRTPLVAIRGYNEMILGEFSGPVTETQKSQLTISLKSIDRLVVLINSLLDFSRLEQNSETLTFERVNFVEIAQESLNLVIPKAQEKNISLIPKFVATEHILFVDRNKIFQVLLNLLENAIKFTPKNGRISVSIKLTSNDMLSCSIRDTGIGIDKNLLNQIFDRFYQVDSSSTRKFGGIGIGLAICHDIIKLHNGIIYAENGESSGSIFTFTLPLAPAAKEPETITNRVLPTQTIKTLNRILIIDNDQNVREKIEKILISLGYHPIVAATGTEALNLLKFETVDAVLVDLAIHDMNGLDICQTITTANTSLPVIILSSQPPEKIEIKAARAGATGVVKKPIQTENLLAALKLLQ